ncbi:hypothetical protein D3C80_1455160 [compost metagenome]
MTVIVVRRVEIAVQRRQQVTVTVILAQMPEHHAAQLLLLDVLRLVLEAFDVVVGNKQAIGRVIQVRRFGLVVPQALIAVVAQ